MIPLERLQLGLDELVIGHGTDAPVGRIDNLGLGRLRERVYERPFADGSDFGHETREGTTWDIHGQVTRPNDEAGAWSRVQQIEAAFDTGERFTPRAVKALRFRRPGSPTRVFYGRPGEFEWDPAQAMIGVIPFSGTFRLAAAGCFSEDEQEATIRLAATSSGGLVTAPDGSIPSPITTLGGSRRASIVVNGGDLETWPVIYVRGPITSPSVTLIDGEGGVLWRLAIAGSLAYDQVAVLDTRPWQRSARLSGGGALGSPLTPDSVLSRAVIPPGQWEVVARGVDTTGTSQFNVRWRNRYRGI